MRKATLVLENKDADQDEALNEWANNLLYILRRQRQCHALDS
jgi:hypothetical protein